MTDKRLLCAASLVRDGALLADIGTDHAYLPTYLTAMGRIRRAVAADIGEGPAASARQTVETAGFADVIDVRVCDGLRGVTRAEVTDIVIAGMGGETIMHILGDAPWVKEESIRLVLQPMTKIVELRMWLFQNGFSIDEERVVRDGHHIYCVMAAHFADAVMPADPVAAYRGALPLNAETRPYFSRQCLYLRKKIEGLLSAGRRDEADALMPILQTLTTYV